MSSNIFTDIDPDFDIYMTEYVTDSLVKKRKAIIKFRYLKEMRPMDR